MLPGMRTAGKYADYKRIVNLNGIINIYKERGYTSHDVVARLRGITGQRKMGHTGTLDPDAEGVLPVCLGTATKACDVLTDKTKSYETVMLLGIATDSQDISGKITERADEAELRKLTDEQIREAIMSMVGEYDQLPPMFSAVRLGGQRLYEMARAGKEVERRTRRVEISSIDITSDIVRRRADEEFRADDLYDNSRMKKYIGRARDEQGRFERTSGCIYNEMDADSYVIRVAFAIECSKGTYVRTVCNDIGEKLGVHACMERLVRTRVSGFSLEDSLLLSEVEELVRNDELAEPVICADSCFMDYKRLDTKEKYDELLYNGNQLWFRHFSQYINDPPSPVRVYSSKGEFLGIYEYLEGRNKYTPVKVFYSVGEDND